MAVRRFLYEYSKFDRQEARPFTLAACPFASIHRNQRRNPSKTTRLEMRLQFAFDLLGGILASL